MKLKEIRQHELYRTYISTSEMCRDVFEEFAKHKVDSEMFLKLQEKLDTISEVYKEVCNLTTKRHIDIL